MQLNSSMVNDGQVNGSESYTLNNLLSIAKTISKREVFTGSLLSIAKNIIATQATAPLLTVGKLISNAALPSTFYSRNGWEPIISLGGITLREIDLTGGIIINKNEGDNHTASFSIILYPNTYNLYTYQGQAVKIYVRQGGVVYPLFTGIVDTPSVDVIGEKLTLNCVADRRVLIGNLSAVEPYIGFYSASVFGGNDDTLSRINNRMSTIPSSLDFDSSNNYAITGWTAKASPDFTFGSSTVYRRNPQMSIDSAGQIINKVNIDLEYGYQRHHSRAAAYSWRHPYAPTNIATGVGNICPFLRDRPSMPSKQMILSAIESAGWAISPGSLYFGKQFLSGSYRCGDVWAQWSTIETQTQNLLVKNANGTTAVDSKGNPLYRSVPTVVADNTNVYTMYAQWVATSQHTQNIKETYSLTIQSPESISRYGTIANDESYGYTAVDQYRNWEQARDYVVKPTNVTTYTDSPSGSYFFNGDQDRATFINAYTCAINKAKTQILKSHRQSRINFQRALLPTVELKHTVALSGKWMRGKGKCERITHYLNISDNNGGVGGEAYTDITLLQYRGRTTVSETPLTVTSAPSDTNVPTQLSPVLGTHLGQDPTTTAAATWNGYIGNNSIYTQTTLLSFAYTRSNYQESFVVDTPIIGGELRDDRVLGKTASYDINIPNDDTVYQSYG